MTYIRSDPLSLFEVSSDLYRWVGWMGSIREARLRNVKRETVLQLEKENFL